MVDTDLVKEIEEFIKKTKKLHKILYQLAFIATGEGPEASMALEYIRRLAESGVYTPKQVQKAIEDAKRFRMLIDLNSSKLSKFHDEIEYGEGA